MELVAVHLREIFNPVQQRRPLPATGRTSLTWHTTSVSARQAILPHPKKYDVQLSFLPPFMCHSRWVKRAEYCGWKLHIREAFWWSWKPINWSTNLSRTYWNRRCVAMCTTPAATLPCSQPCIAAQSLSLKGHSNTVHKMRGISSLAEELLASPTALCCMELIGWLVS